MQSRLAAASVISGVPSTEVMDLQTVSTLLGIEATNSFGVMAATECHGDRSLRGTGIYPKAAVFNHECLPNLARLVSVAAISLSSTRSHLGPK